MSQRIEDAGAFLPGAAKHVAVLAGSSTQTGRLLDEVFPEPDWQARIHLGQTPGTAALLAMLYQGFATNPMAEGAWGLSAGEHREHFIQCARLMRQLFERATNETREQLVEKFHAATGVPREINGLDIRQIIGFYALGRFGGKTLKSPFSMTSRAMNLASALPDLGWPAERGALKTGICHWLHAQSGMYGVGRFLANGYQQLVAPSLDRHSAAVAARRHIAEELDRSDRDRKGVPRKRKLDSLTRCGGDDVRFGSDVTAEDLLQRYRLRGVQFGESLSQAERQRWLNESFDALHDLSVATGLEPKWLGLSKLGLALGARGKSGSAAHYEPALRVINLTRMSGAGAAAHEWGHALDHHLAHYTFEFGRHGYGWIEYVSEGEFELQELLHRTSSNPEIAAAILRIQTFLSMDTNFRRAALKIESLKGARKNYWTKPREMFARGCEAAIQDLLGAKGISSPWLVHGTTAAELPNAAVADPYPQGDERRVMTRLLKNLFDSISAAAGRHSAKG